MQAFERPPVPTRSPYSPLLSQVGIGGATPLSAGNRVSTASLARSGVPNHSGVAKRAGGRHRDVPRRIPRALLRPVLSAIRFKVCQTRAPIAEKLGLSVVFAAADHAEVSASVQSGGAS